MTRHFDTSTISIDYSYFQNDPLTPVHESVIRILVLRGKIGKIIWIFHSESLLFCRTSNGEAYSTEYK